MGYQDAGSADRLCLDGGFGRGNGHFAWSKIACPPFKIASFTGIQRGMHA